MARYDGGHRAQVIQIDDYRKRKLLGYLLVKHPFLSEKMEEFNRAQSDAHQAHSANASKPPPHPQVQQPTR